MTTICFLFLFTYQQVFMSCVHFAMQIIYHKTLISGAREHRRTMRLELSLFANLGWINTLSSLDCDFIISELGVFLKLQ